MNYQLDKRGLHPLDHGFVFAVRYTDPDKEKGKRRWFKSRSSATNSAAWHRSRGRTVVVLRYTIGDEVEVTNLPERGHTND